MKKINASAINQASLEMTSHGVRLFDAPLVMDVRDVDYCLYFDDEQKEEALRREVELLSPVIDLLKSAEQWMEGRGVSPSDRMAMYEKAKVILAAMNLSLDQFSMMEDHRGDIQILYSPSTATPMLLEVVVLDAIHERRAIQPKLDWDRLTARLLPAQTASTMEP